MIKVATNLLEEIGTIEIESEEFIKIEAEFKLDIDYYWALLSTIEIPFEAEL